MKTMQLGLLNPPKAAVLVEGVKGLAAQLSLIVCQGAVGCRKGGAVVQALGLELTLIPLPV